MKKIFVTLGIAAIAVIGTGVFSSCKKDIVEPNIENEHQIVQKAASPPPPEEKKYYQLKLCKTADGDNGTMCQSVAMEMEFSCKTGYACRKLECAPPRVEYQLDRIVNEHGQFLYYKEFISEFRLTFDYLYEVGELTVAPDVLYERAPTKDEYYATMQ